MRRRHEPSRTALIDRFRRFNRFYTNIIGVLRRRLHDSPLRLAEARTLFEIRNAPGISAVALSGMLHMDRSQLSRILTRLHKTGLIQRDSAPAGRKAVPLHPTPKGIGILDDVDAAANAHAAALLRHLDDEAATRLDAALAEVEALLAPQAGCNGRDRLEGRGSQKSRENSFSLRPARSGDMAWIIDRHVRLYGAEHGFDADFERYVLLSLAAYTQLPDSLRSGLFLAETQGRRLGSVGIVQAQGNPAQENMAQLRWLLVTPEARGKGVGRALVQHACDFSAEHGYAGIFLWTLDFLAPARRLYASFGFRLSETKPGLMGGQSIVEERWERRLP
jgi:DNA-binding MarR family transcriptional regulator/GNAT superfamily N-acetyltransferase